MRRTSVVWMVVVLLMVAAAPRAAAQHQQTAQDPPIPVSPAAAAREPSDSVVKVRKPGVGPQLPDYVPSVSARVDAKPAAPRGNIIIPVTTALIVLAALVVVLILT